MAASSGVASERPSRAALTLARIRSRLPSSAMVAFKRVGEFRILFHEIALIDEDVRFSVEELAWFRLIGTWDQAWLGLTLSLCHGLIRSVLGDAQPSLIRPLGPSEGGMMAAIVTSALNSLKVPYRVAPAASDASPELCGARILITGEVEGAGMAGQAIFLGPLPTRAVEAVGAEVEGVLELGRCVLPTCELAATGPGDAIVFGGIPSLDPAGLWPVNLLVGEDWGRACLAPDGSLTLEGDWGAVDQASDRRWKVAEESRTRDEVEVVAELGRIGLRGDELAGLCQKSTIALGARPMSRVGLRVGGQLWATGALVAIDGQLGIRVLGRCEDHADGTAGSKNL